MCSKLLSNLQRGGMPQFCILFYAKYTILATQRKVHGPMAPPLNTPVRTGVLIRRIIASQLCRADGCQQFCEESRKLQTIILFESCYSFIHYFLLSSLYVMFQKRILTKPKWNAQAVVRGHGLPLPLSQRRHCCKLWCLFDCFRNAPFKCRSFSILS